MKSFYLLFLMFLFNNNLLSQSFMGITIDGTQESIKTKLLQKGFKLVSNRDNGYLYKGEINNDDVEILVVSTPISKKVYSLYVMFEEMNSWNKLKSKFEDMNDILVGKYGKPLEEEREYEYPFSEADEMQLLALESEKLKYSNLWKGVGENNQLGITLSINSRKQVCLFYGNLKNMSNSRQENKIKEKDIF